MADPVIITCAVTGGGDTAGRSEAVPVTPEEIATSAIDAGKAGAAIAHIHVRDPATGQPSMELAHYREVVERIRDSGSPIVINLTTGPGARFFLDEDDPMVPGPNTTLATAEHRVQHVLELKPEFCSLDMGSMNFGPNVFVNTPGVLGRMAAAILDAGIKPELEVFESGHIRLAAQMIENGEFEPPVMFQICLGISWGMPATPEALMFMRDLLPPGVNWAAFGISRMQFPFVAQSVLMGGHVRVGLEDNLYLERGVMAPSNAALVERAADIISVLGWNVASSDEARAALGIGVGKKIKGRRFLGRQSPYAKASGDTPTPRLRETLLRQGFGRHSYA